MKPHTLLDIKDDFKLCNLVYKAIGDRYERNLDVAVQMEHERIVTLTWFVCGIIGNGGFNDLIEHRIKGDPQYQLIVAAHRRIGCHIAAEAISEFLDIFSNRLPPFDMMEKYAIYDVIPEKTHNDLDWRYLKEYDELDSMLASFIRKNRAEFIHLSESVPPDEPPQDEKSILESLRSMLALIDDDPQREDLRKLILERIEECERKSNSSA